MTDGTPSASHVHLAVEDGIATVSLRRPEARNAINGAVARQLDEAFTVAEGRSDVDVVVLAAAGTVFCAGADLKAIAAGDRGFNLPGSGFAGLVLRERVKPLIAAVDGPAVAGGFEIVLACDLVVASRAASFALPEVKRSLIAAAGGVIRLPRLIPRNLAMELILTGEPISAQRAHELGLVNRVVEPSAALDNAFALARRVRAGAPLAVQASLRIAKASVDSNAHELWDLTEQLAAELATTEDAAEGPLAFIEKREPHWKGR